MKLQSVDHQQPTHGGTSLVWSLVTAVALAVAAAWCVAGAAIAGPATTSVLDVMVRTIATFLMAFISR
jgi:hypothetical protein